MNLEKVKEKCKEMGSKELMRVIAKYAEANLSDQDRYIANPVIHCATEEIEARRKKYYEEKENEGL